MVSKIAILIVFIGSILSAIGALLLKKSSLNLSIKAIFKNKHLIMGLFFYSILTILFIYALKLEKLSLLFPLASITYIWVILLSSLILKEHITKFRMAGIFLIIMGIVIMGFNA